MQRQIAILSFESDTIQDHRYYKQPIHDQRFAPVEPISEEPNTSQTYYSNIKR